MVDVKVKQSLARQRRGLVSVDWRGRNLPAGQPAHGVLHPVDDLLAYHLDALRAANVGWNPSDEAWEDRSTPRWRPSPEMNAFVQRLSATVDAESSVLVGLAARARDAARGVALAGSLAIGDAGRSQARDAIEEALSEIAESGLEAALCAVRTGVCARSLIRCDSCDGEIAAALRAASDEIDARIGAIEDRGAGIAARIVALRPVARKAKASPGETAGVAARAASEVADETRELAGLVDGLSARIVEILRESPAGDRRRAKRLAFDAPCAVKSAWGAVSGRIVDISLGGALVELSAPAEFRRGQPSSLAIAGMPEVAATVAGVSRQGLHLAFDLGHAANAQARPPLLRMLAALHRRDDAFIERAIALAGAAGEALSGEAGEIAALIDGLVEDGRGLVYALLMDRRGFVAHAAFAPGWRDAAAPLVAPPEAPREDAAARRHARNRRPCLTQNLRLAGRSLRSVSAPVSLDGEHWGCVEIAFDPSVATELTEVAEIVAPIEQDQG